WGSRDGAFSVRLRGKRQAKASAYEPPYWCPPSERWRFQLGYLLRFILTKRVDFVRPVTARSGQPSLGHRYRPAAAHWHLRRYGFFSAHEAFGDRWLPITGWMTELLLDLLAWPGI